MNASDADKQMMVQRLKEMEDAKRRQKNAKLGTLPTVINKRL